MEESRPCVLGSLGGVGGHCRGSDSQPVKLNGDETQEQRPARSRWYPSFGPGPVSEVKGLSDYQPSGILVFFLTKVHSSSTWTWESLRSRRSMSLTCSQCKADVANHLRMVSSLTSRTREVPRRPKPSARSLSPIRTFFLGLRRSKNAVPARLENAFPQVRQRKSRALPVLRVR